MRSRAFVEGQCPPDGIKIQAKNWREAQKALVAGIALLLRAERADHLHQAAAHIAMEGIVGREGAALVPSQPVPHREQGLAPAE